ncbi:MAG: hypothetical protein HKN37_04545 [Rhodothermales bacterium]|nr:hypothetical protein [Rhodothermales bacterium]
MRVARSILFVVLQIGAVVAAPDCAYTRYGCTYLIWYHGDGSGEAIVSCDEGARWYWYTGSVGTCPGTGG